MIKAFKRLVDTSTGKPLAILVPGRTRIRYRNIITGQPTTRRRIREQATESAARILKAFPPEKT